MGEGTSASVAWLDDLAYQRWHGERLLAHGRERLVELMPIFAPMQGSVLTAHEDALGILPRFGWPVKRR